MKTEEEARQCWCPFVRLAAPIDSEASGTAGNRYGDDHGKNFCCIASECMAWRWDEQWAGGENRPNGPGWELWETAPGGRNAKWVKRLVGYCGLAGKP